MANIISTITEHRLSRKQRHGNVIGEGCPNLIKRANDLYEIREKAFVRVLFRKPNGLYSNVTILAAHSLSDDEMVALAIREYGVPGRTSVVMVEHVMHQYLAFI